GGRPRRVVRLDAQFTRSVPALRSPRGRGFTLLRQSNAAYHDLANWFGPSFHAATVAFRLTEIQKLARRLMRARRTVQRTNGQKEKRTKGSWSPVAYCNRPTSDQGCGRQAEVECHNDNESADQRGQSRRKMAAAGKPRYHNPGARWPLRTNR